MTRSTITCDQGDVIIVNIPFSNHSGLKPRPALVVSPAAFHRRLPDVIVCPISSQPRYYRRPGPGDHPLAAWQDVGLRHPSTVRVSKLLAVDKQIIKRVLGTISPADSARVNTALRSALGLT